MVLPRRASRPYLSSDMERRTFIAALAALAAAPGHALAQDQVLVEVSKYLNQLRSVQGRFTQTNANGSKSRGEYYLVRPGRIRFDYEGSDAMVLADGINVGVFDPKSSLIVQRYPLKTTPLRFLLRDRIDLTQQNLSRGTASRNGYTYVTLQDPRAPGDGSMTLELRNKPPTLTSWTTTDKAGQKTRVQLDTLETASGLSRRMFNIEWHELQIKNGR